MNENKEEIWYILKFYYKKGRMQLRLLNKFLMFMDMMQYQYVSQNWFKHFQSRDFDVKNAFRSG